VTGSRLALVTGAAGAIGGAICADLAAAGWRVVGLDRQVPEKDAALVDFLQADLADSAGLAATLQAYSGRDEIAALVNCAGVSRVEPFVEQDSAVWQQLMQVNCMAVYATCQALLPAMIARGHGRIVQITSDSARTGAAGEAVYAGSKSAVVAFSKSVAQEVGRHGVTVNCVSPGAIQTPMSAPNQELLEKFARRVPLKRLGVPEDVAGIVTFLCSDSASYITGQVVSVGGGVTMVG